MTFQQTATRTKTSKIIYYGELSGEWEDVSRYTINGRETDAYWGAPSKGNLWHRSWHIANANDRFEKHEGYKS